MKMYKAHERKRVICKMLRDKKKMYMIVGIVTAILLVSIGGFFIFQSKKDNPEKTWNTYIDLLNEKKYEDMYAMLTPKSKREITQEAFVKRNKSIYEGMETSKVSYQVTDTEKNENGEEILSFTMKLETTLGTIDLENSVGLVKESDAYLINWKTNTIFPDLDASDKVTIQTINAKRGQILDRNNKALATQGDMMEVGIVPGKLGENKEEAIQAIAKKLDMSTESINNALAATWVQDDLFVPLKTVAYDSASITEYKKLAGVAISVVEGRVYPYGKVAAHLTGYIQAINEEELNKLKDQGYTTASKIGKTGLESIYETELKGSDGCLVAILDENGNQKKSILEKEVKNGQDVKTTIDIEVQKTIYNEVEKDEASATAMNPKTGEVLALVSTPAYDPNDFVLGMDTKSWDALNNDKKKPINNRFVSAYSPGSTFKGLTGAFGLDAGTIKVDTDYGKEKDWKWQKDQAWGDHFVTTLARYDEPSNLANALKYSDNVYFAKLATNIGDKEFTKRLKQVGFDEPMKFEFTMPSASYGSAEDLTNASTLADSGYGQGKLQVSTTYMASAYSAFVNEGNMIQPYLKYNDGKSSIWKANAISKESAAILMKDLVATMDHYGPNPTKAGGKTGTAEVVGTNQLGWLVSVQDGTTPLALAVMIENTEKIGQSTYVIPKVQKILQSIK